MRTFFRFVLVIVALAGVALPMFDRFAGAPRGGSAGRAEADTVMSVQLIQ
jgi:hypothetical protein